jgi:hypothetical protein
MVGADGAGAGAAASSGAASPLGPGVKQPASGTQRPRQNSAVTGRIRSSSGWVGDGSPADSPANSKRFAPFRLGGAACQTGGEAAASLFFVAAFRTRAGSASGPEPGRPASAILATAEHKQPHCDFFAGGGFSA